MVVLKVGATLADPEKASLPVNSPLAAVSEPVQKVIDVGGYAFEYHSKRRHLHLFISGDETETSETVDEVEVSDDDDEEDLGHLDPADWKSLDHYALLGLGKKRWKASDDDIKKAYKKMVLKHHPDKKSTATATEQDRKRADAHFACIQKAYEVLVDEDKRVLYDSVDHFDDTVPSVCKDEKNFFKTFRSVMESNSRFLHKAPPPMGDDSSTKEEITRFYDFWRTARSWREVGYYDEELKDTSKAENREERRWMEKQNKGIQLKYIREEKTRMQRLIENCYNSDPRVRRFKEEERKVRDEKRLREEAERKIEAERKAAMQKEALEKKLREEESQKSEEKRLVDWGRKVRKNFMKNLRKHGIVSGSDEGEGSTSASTSTPLPSSSTAPSESLTMENIDLIKTRWPLEKLEEVSKMEDKEKVSELLMAEVRLIVAEYLEKNPPKVVEDVFEMAPWSKEEQKLLEDAMKTVAKDHPDRFVEIAKLVPGRTKKECIARIKECAAKVKKQKPEPEEVKMPVEWTNHELQALVKGASKVYPPGTQGNRWELLAVYVQTHAHTAWKRPAKDIVAKVNDMKNVSSGLTKKKEEEDAFDRFSKGQTKTRTVEAEFDPSQRSVE